LSYPKLDASRKFTNKLWNMARFIEMKKIQGKNAKEQSPAELSIIAKMKMIKR